MSVKKIKQKIVIAYLPSAAYKAYSAGMFQSLVFHQVNEMRGGGGGQQKKKNFTLLCCHLKVIVLWLKAGRC